MALFPVPAVNDDRAPVEITSKNGRAELISADEWEAWQETVLFVSLPGQRPQTARCRRRTGCGPRPAG